MELDIEREFYYLAASFGDLPQHEEARRPEPMQTTIIWSAVAFWAISLTAVGVSYYYIGRSIYHAVFG